MKHEVKLDQQALADVLHREYGLEVAQFTYFPQGEVGINYILTCRDGERHFLKLYPGSRLARWSIGRLDFTLALTRALFDRGLLDRLAYPIPTRHGELKAAFQGMPLILYNYIPGENLMDRYPYSLAVLEQAAGLIASLHNSTPHLGLEVPFVDDFTAHFEAELRRELDALGTVSSSARPGQQALRDLIFPQRQLVLGLVDEMHQLAERVRRLPLEPVICHTDANQANLIMGDSGELYLVDWEGAMLAPAEHDLFIFTGDGFDRFLWHYRRHRPGVRLYPEVFAFYFYRRNLEDLEDWLARILYENTTAEQDDNDLSGILQDCVSGWPFLPDAIERMRVQLV